MKIMKNMSHYERVLVIADDLTGANDTAVQFTKAGVKGVSTLYEELIPKLLSDYEVVALSTESRALEPSEAYQRLYLVGQKIKDFINLDKTLIYKKMDSTIRGNFVEEIKGLLDTLPFDLVIFAPAYPKLGRTTIKGIHLVNGIPVDKTFYGRDPRKPVKNAYIPSYFEDVFRNVYRHVYIDEVRSGTFINYVNNYRVLSFDAETDQDLDRIVRGIINTGKKILWVGSAGLAEALYENIVIGRPVNKPLLFVVGSVNDVSRKQVTAYIENMVSELVLIDIQNLFDNFEEELKKVKEKATEALNKNIDIILTTSYTEEQITSGKKKAEELRISLTEFGGRLSGLLGRLTASLLDVVGFERIGGILATGGDTAVSIMKNLGVEYVEIIREIAPAVPLLKYKNKPFIIKGGGVGDENLFIRVKFILASS